MPDGLWMLLVAAMIGAGCGLDGQLGERCHPSGRCSVRMSVCVDNVCRCPDSTVASARNNRCLPVAAGLKHHCEEDGQCSSPHAFCRRKFKECDCRKGYIVSRDKSTCLPERRLGEACLESAQCKDITECSPARSVCVCRGISYEFNGECVIDHNSKDWELTVVTVSPAAASHPRAHSRWLLCIMLAALVRTGVR